MVKMVYIEIYVTPLMLRDTNALKYGIIALYGSKFRFFSTSVDCHVC